MNRVAVLTVPRFTGQADTSPTGEEVSDIEQTYLTERGHAGVSDQGRSPLDILEILEIFWSFSGQCSITIEKVLQPCQVCNSTNAFFHYKMKYIITFITFFLGRDIIAVMHKNTIMLFSQKKI